MSRLPEPGEAQRAIETLRERGSRVADYEDGALSLGVVLVGDGDMDGDGATTTRLIYGDLVDVADLMGDGGVNIVTSGTLAIYLGTQDIASGLASMLVQGVGIGVLMERARWQK